MLPSFNSVTFVVALQLNDGAAPSTDNNYRWIITDPSASFQRRVIATQWESTSFAGPSVLIDVRHIYGVPWQVLEWARGSVTPLQAGQVMHVQYSDRFRNPGAVTVSLECDPGGSLIFSAIRRKIAYENYSELVA